MEQLSSQEKNMCPLITLEEKKTESSAVTERQGFFIVLLLLSLFPTLIQVQNTNFILKYLSGALKSNTCSQPW